MLLSNHKKSLLLFVQYKDSSLKKIFPYTLLKHWVKVALYSSAILTIRFVDIIEGQKLNYNYRKKKYATNILTFVYSKKNKPIHADLVLCVDVLQFEIKKYNKIIEEHVAHLIIHGILHAQGYCHKTTIEANKMKKIEIKLLKILNISNPYNNY
ncbi:rRNA maturation RNase YbeY [Candidatus Profftella armatura (Diaphorina cf. continua)]|uniref:Endoribonuclease YbeY n=1 Tax=Candidatus Profftella armatura (Diaphorina cf. continua) TaxID=2661583 RepID=A0A7R6VYX7_9PROT|nr:rRNA maturation RNase YbeY [Candidatus Profftella armatura (Diaphorina cf. continua)]BCG49649.1 rRNA maturation RNase YbeY [Candidatus Profftella armatura (Diaphorina cf. continua)]